MFLRQSCPGRDRGGDLADVRAGHHQRPAGDGRATADALTVVLVVQVQEHDRQVALQVLLLIDRERHRVVLEVLLDAGVQVERRDLRFAGRRTGDQCRPDRVVERHHRVDPRVRLQIRGDLADRLLRVRCRVRRRQDHLGAGRALRGRAAGLALRTDSERHRNSVAPVEQILTRLVDDAQDIRGTGFLEGRARGLARELLGLTDAGQRAAGGDVLVVTARVEQHDRDAGRGRLGQRWVHQRGIVVGHRHAVHLRVDRVLDLRVLGIVVGLRLALLLGPVGLGERAPEVGGGVLGALVHDAPEAAVVAVGDQRELVRAGAADRAVVDADEAPPRARRRAQRLRSLRAPASVWICSPLATPFNWSRLAGRRRGRHRRVGRRAPEAPDRRARAQLCAVCIEHE